MQELMVEIREIRNNEQDCKEEMLRVLKDNEQFRKENLALTGWTDWSIK